MIERLVSAINSITTQVWAMLMLVIGIAAIILFHRNGIAVDSAAAIVGAAVNMFTGLVNKGQPGPSPTAPVATAQVIEASPKPPTQEAVNAAKPTV